MKKHIIVVDDDKEILSFMDFFLSEQGYQVSIYSSPIIFLENYKKNLVDKFDLIISDIKMPEINGTEFIQKLRTQGLVKTPVLFMTAFGSLDTAVEAIRSGAFDFFLKPINKKEVLMTIEKAFEYFSLSEENEVLREHVSKEWSQGEIIGKSQAILKVLDVIKRISTTEASVLISGESGTGKELIARAIHYQSNRSGAPFMAVNCAAIPENLLESELFGHGKGAFTGAQQRKKGLFLEAQGGTLFLDEIGDLPLHLQSKLLRVLQEKQIRPVGESKSIDLDVRIVSATHKNLKEAILKNEFREDLYYRLCVLPIDLPPLRERKEDIPLLIEKFLKSFSILHKRKVTGLSSESLKKVISYSWPGNIRELKNVLERAVILSKSELLEEDDILIQSIETAKSPENLMVFAAGEAVPGELVSLKEIEMNYIKHVLNSCDGVKEKAAKILGIDRKTLYRKEKEFQVH